MYVLVDNNLAYHQSWFVMTRSGSIKLMPNCITGCLTGFLELGEQVVSHGRLRWHGHVERKNKSD